MRIGGDWLSWLAAPTVSGSTIAYALEIAHEITIKFVAANHFTRPIQLADAFVLNAHTLVSTTSPLAEIAVPSSSRMALCVCLHGCERSVVKRVPE